MRRMCFLLLAVSLLAACGQGYDQKNKVSAFMVPKSSDFVFENDVVCFRIHGEGVEDVLVTPGIDVWVKKPGALVARKWCHDDLRKKTRMEDDHDGMGRDCFRVGRTLGAGGSALLIDSTLVFPQVNYRSADILRHTADEFTFVLHYPGWKFGANQEVWLDKQITIKAGSNFCKVIDYYNGYFDEVTVAAGIALHDGAEAFSDTLSNGVSLIANWEYPSADNVTPEYGMIGTSVFSQEADSVIINGPGNNAVITKNVAPDEPFVYYIGSCWSLGNVSDKESWISLVRESAIL